MNQILVPVAPGRYRYVEDGESFPEPPSSPDIFPGLPDPLTRGELITKDREWAHLPETQELHTKALKSMLITRIPRPIITYGDGVVICGGGKYWPMACVTVQMIRRVSDLPIQIWYRGHSEQVGNDLDNVSGVTLHDASKFPTRILRGWECKTVALLQCGFERVFCLDADAYPVSDFHQLMAITTPQTPFVFWEDLHSQTNRVNWNAIGSIGSNGVPPIQGGHIFIHRREWWRELVLSHWLNMHSDFYYCHYFGDQDSWRVILSMTAKRYFSLGMVEWSYPAYVCRLPDKRPVIIHRAQGKTWQTKSMYGTARNLPGEQLVSEYYKQHQNRTSLII
jgi:hypothetical protein